MTSFPVPSHAGSIPATGRAVGAALLLCMAAGQTPALSQTLNYGSLEALFGEAVTTSVTGSPQRASEVPATMVIITAEQIRRSGAVDIPGVLRHVTGVDVQRWTSNGADIALRGYNEAFSSRLLVLVNGRQVYADHHGYTPWSSLPVELGEIRQIEVVKGPNSALFGFNAVGGVINIITFSPLHDAVNFVEVRGGSQAHMQASGATTVALGQNGAVRLSAGVRRNDDFETPEGILNEGLRRGDERDSARLDFHYDLMPGVTAEVETSYTETSQINMTPPLTLGFEETTVTSLKGHIAADTSMGLTQAMLYRNEIDNDVFISMFDSQGGSSISPTPLLRFRNEVTVGQLQHSFKIGADHTLRLSGEYRESMLNTTPVAGGIVEYDVLSGGAMWNWQISPALTMTAAVRRDSLDLGRSGTFPAGLAQSNADWDRSLHETSFNAGLVWQASALDTLRLTTARGVQLPSLYNLGGSQFEITLPPGIFPPKLFVVSSPDLEPTRVTNYELAWDRKLPAINGDLRAAYFTGETTSIVSDWGDADFANLIVSKPANIGDSRTRGFELTLAGVMRTVWRWKLGYINQNIDDSFGPRYPAGLTFTNFEDVTPEHIGYASLGWSGGQWELDVFLQYQSGHGGLRADPNAAPGGDPTSLPMLMVNIADFTAVNTRVGYRFNEHMDIALSAHNMFTSEQAQTSGPKVERRILGTFTLRF